MDRIVLQPCRVRAGRIIPDQHEEAIKLTLVEAFKKLVPSGSPIGGLLLRRTRVGDFIGLRKRGKIVTNFVLNSTTGGSLSAVLRKHPTFANELLEVYKISETHWDATMEEMAA